MSETNGHPVRALTQGDMIRVYGALLVQQGTPLLVGAVLAEHAVRQAKVDTFDPDTKSGYQRIAVPSRVREASKYYENGGKMPNPLLANIRKKDFDRVRITVTSGEQAAFEQALDEGSNWLGAGNIEFPKDLDLWIFDGQHRNGGVEMLLKRMSAFSTFPVPISVTLGLSTTQEMKEFYEVNTNAKSVKTDLAWELLHQLAAEDPDLADELELKGKDWTSKGIDVIRALESIKGPWTGRIQAPNQRKSRSDGFTIAQAQFIRSLKPVLDMPLFQRQPADVIAQVIDAYWRGIALVLPEPFDPASPADHWVIQKGPGTIPLHRVLPRVIEVIRANGQRLGDPHAYADVLQRLKDLSGETTDEASGETITVGGADFWRGGSAGIASAFTGEAGRKRLFLTLQALLPKPSASVIL